VKLAALLVEIRRLMPPLPPAHVDPLRAIYQRCEALPRTSSERQTLERLALTITQGSESDFDEREVWKLPREALGLLDALIERRLEYVSGSAYSEQSTARTLRL
jgi:hypothetical protein